MAVAEQPWPRCAPYQSPNTNTCQDLGNSILLLLGLIICINIGINLVTLLWRRLRVVLHHMFCNIVSEIDASKPSSPEKKTPHPKQSSPAVHLRCTMDPVKLTVTPPPTRRKRHRGRSAHPAHHPAAWAPDTEEERSTMCSYHWDGPLDWEGFQSSQGFWAPWAQDAVEQPPQNMHFQNTLQGRPLKREMRSEISLEAYVYPVNPPLPSPQNHKNCGKEAGAEKEQEKSPPDAPASPPTKGPAIIPDIPRHCSSRRIVYDALDVRRRLRELTKEVEALSHCYPMAFKPNPADGMEADWLYRPLIDK